MIAIVSGTNRPESRTRMIVGEVIERYRSLSASYQLLDLAELPAEIFSPTAYQDKPDVFTPFASTVLESDGLVVVTPEYNGSFPGVLKYFIDMLKFPESFENRPVCFVGLSAGSWGALRAVEQLQQIFGYRNAYLYPGRVFIPEVYRRLDDEGRLNDPDLVQRLERQADGFLKFVGQIKSLSG